MRIFNKFRGTFQRNWVSIERNGGPYIVFYYTGYHLFFHIPIPYKFSYGTDFERWEAVPLPETTKQEEEILLPSGFSIQGSDFADEEVHLKLKWDAGHLSILPLEFNVTIKRFSVLHAVSYRDQGVRFFDARLLIPSFVFYKDFYGSKVQFELRKQARKITESQASALLEDVATGKLLETHPLVAVARTKLGNDSSFFESSLKARERWNDCYSPKWVHRRLQGSFGSRTGG